MNHTLIDLSQGKVEALLVALGKKPYFWICFLILLVAPFKILTFNYQPIDDAKRHVGKVVSGKEWSEILVMREEVQNFDHNHGWHQFLTLVSRTGADPEALLMFSCVFLFTVFALTGLFLFQEHPISWMMALIIGGFTGTIIRLMLGRPFLFSSTMFLVLMHAWDDTNDISQRKKSLITLVCIGLAGYIHGAWHLFALLPMALFASGRVRDAIVSGLMWVLGSVLAGFLTLRPADFLWKQIFITFESTGDTVRQRLLVGEFQPAHNIVPMLLLGLLFALSKKDPEKGTKNYFPECVVLLCWVLGFMNGRFWNDWGNVALMYCTARFLSKQDVFAQLRSPLQILNLKLLAVAGFFFLFTSDAGSRWSNHDFVDSLRLEDPEHTEWLPSAGGILYAADMMIFYDTFFNNPHGEWKYILGFEPTFMPEEDLAIYRNIQFYGPGHPNVFDPWVEKMTESDRLIVRGGKSTEPNIQGLKWQYVAFNTWSGRVPAPSSGPQEIHENAGETE